ncbi:Mur ligase, partial [Dothidotthia symphoricarpi CBS 119687]
MSTARIQPGLERIAQLVKGVTYPWNSIHVAGTNGKGSICHYASSLLTQRHIRCGKFTSPHLVDRWDCISVNNKTVQEAHFREVEKHYIQLDQTRKINASPFEILTATAFHIFNDEKVQIGVIEVGMGGKLDATNILDNQVISVISKIARDHEKFLGGSLGEITMHKAGILRPQVPFVVNPVNEWHVQDVVDEYAKEIGAGPRLRVDDPEINSMLYPWEEWHRFASQLRPFQKDNVVLAVIAVRQALESINESTNITKLRRLLPTIPPNPGRIQKVRVPPVFGTPNKSEKPERHILVDGAHNRDAAYALNGYVDKFERRKLIRGEMPPKDGWPVTWVLAMGQDRVPRKFLEIILQPGDSVVTTKFGPVDGMPWVTPKDPQDLLQSACAIRPNITGVCVPSVGALRAVTTAKYLTQERHPIVLTGSLYLVGQFFRELRSRQDERWWTDESKELDRALFREIHEEERARAYRAFGS